MCPTHGYGYCTCVGDSFFASIGQTLFLVAGIGGLLFGALVVFTLLFAGSN